MPQRFLEVQPSVGFDDLVASVNVSGASAGAAGLVALAAELLTRRRRPTLRSGSSAPRWRCASSTVLQSSSLHGDF